MVAISIVAILATVGYTILQTAQASGRDAKRRSDIDAASQALETNWRPTTSQYPQLVPTMFTTGLPSEPLGTTYGGYYWNGVTTAPVSPATGYSTYTICAQLEKGGGNSSTNTVITSASGATAIYYCKKNQQQ